jgi:hypothetical protein
VVERPTVAGTGYPVAREGDCRTVEVSVAGFLAFLWFVTCLGVMGYGLSNHAVTTLALPRWTSLSIAGLGFLMLMGMFGFLLLVAAQDINWFQPNEFGGPRRGGD